MSKFVVKKKKKPDEFLHMIGSFKIVLVSVFAFDLRK